MRYDLYHPKVTAAQLDAATTRAERLALLEPDAEAVRSIMQAGVERLRELPVEEEHRVHVPSSPAGPGHAQSSPPASPGPDGSDDHDDSEDSDVSTSQASTSGPTPSSSKATSSGSMKR